MVFRRRLLLLLVALINAVVSEKILFLIAFGSRSHRFAMQPIALKLADLGHEVAFLAGVKPEKVDTRITEINFNESFARVIEQHVELGTYAVAERLKGRHYEHLLQGTVWWDVVINAAGTFLSNKDFVEFVSTTHYDLIVGDFTDKELAVVMAYKTNAKVIWLNTGGVMSPVDAELMGLPIESHWLPNLELGSPYWFIPDHVFSTLNALLCYGSYYWYCLPKFDQLFQKNVDTNVPPVERLLQNIDLLLLNERFPYTYPRALHPFAILVGGMHVRYTDGTLPKVILEIRNRSFFNYAIHGIKTGNSRRYRPFRILRFYKFWQHRRL